MPLNYFQEFKVILIWAPGNGGDSQISVRYEPEEGEHVMGGPTRLSLGSFGALTALGAVMSTDVNVGESMPIIIGAGRDLANLLLPEPIRTQFRKVWRKGPVRLRLVYPDPKITDPDEKFVQTTKLLEIPWEHVYLSQFLKDDKEDNPEYLLGLRNDISIVHTLKQPMDPEASLAVDQLRVTMQYLSRLGSEENLTEDNQLFKDFVEELGRLSIVLDCVNLKDNQPFHINQNPAVNIPTLPPQAQAETEDVLLALQHDNLVHLVSHGDPSAIWLGDQPLQSEEVRLKLKLSLFGEIQQQLKAKVALILSCGSGDGDGSVVAALHRTPVQMVIGTTNNIPVEAARHFSNGFYKTMAVRPSDELEKAVSAGRRSVFTPDGDKWYTNFGRFRLFLNSPKSILIPEKQLYGSDEMIKSFDNYIRDALDDIKNYESVSISKEDYQKTLEDYQKRLNEWVLEGATRWYFVSSRPGSGKSVQIAWFVNQYMQGLPVLRANANDGQNDEIDPLIENLRKNPNPKLIYHFCRNDQPKTGDPLTFVQYSLIPQLIQYFGERYYKWCSSDKFPLLTDNAKDALIDFVYTPLSKARDRGFEPPVIVIDGLDFMPPGRGFDSSILGLLHDHRDKLDTVARFIVTADTVEDNDERAKQILNTIKELTYQVTPLDIAPPELPADMTEETNLEKLFTNLDIKISLNPFRSKSQIITTINDPKKPRALTPLFERMVKRFKDFFNYNSLTDIDSLVQKLVSSQGLDHLYQYAFSIAREYYQKDVVGRENLAQQFLDVVALAYEPLSFCDVAALINASDDEMIGLLKVFWRFLTVPEESDLIKFYRQEGNSLRFFHHSLRNYVQREMRQQNRDAAIHNLFVETLLPPEVLQPNGDNQAKPDWANLCGTKWQKRCAANNCTNNNAEQQFSLIPSYVRRYLGYHAYERYRRSNGSDQQNRQERAKEFLKLIGEPGFRTVRLAEMGRDAVVQDIKNGLRVIYTGWALPLNNEENNLVVKAVDRILAANEFDLQMLEQKLRNQNGAKTSSQSTQSPGQQAPDDLVGVPALFKFLDLDPKLWKG